MSLHIGSESLRPYCRREAVSRLWTIALAVGLAGFLSLVFFSHHSAASQDPFVGAWEATDTLDGSSMVLAIGGGPANTHRLLLHDDAATLACPAGGPAIMRGKGTVSGNVFHGDEDTILWCLLERSYSYTGSLDFAYDASTDTLSGAEAPESPPVIWHRMGH